VNRAICKKKVFFSKYKRNVCEKQEILQENYLEALEKCMYCHIGHLPTNIPEKKKKLSNDFEKIWRTILIATSD
jgi:hypothetical protein